MSNRPLVMLCPLVLIVMLMLAQPRIGIALGDNTHLIVSPNGPYTSITQALAQAKPGDEIEVHGGHYDGPIVIDKAITLNGIDWPVIDNHNIGTVVKLTAANAAIRGFEIIRSGDQPDEDHAGITLAAPNTLAENNRLRDVRLSRAIYSAISLMPPP